MMERHPYARYVRLDVSVYQDPSKLTGPGGHMIRTMFKCFNSYCVVTEFWWAGSPTVTEFCWAGSPTGSEFWWAGSLTLLRICLHFKSDLTKRIKCASPGLASYSQNEGLTATLWP